MTVPDDGTECRQRTTTWMITRRSANDHAGISRYDTRGAIRCMTRTATRASIPAMISYRQAPSASCFWRAFPSLSWSPCFWRCAGSPEGDLGSPLSGVTRCLCCRTRDTAARAPVLRPRNRLLPGNLWRSGHFGSCISGWHARCDLQGVTLTGGAPCFDCRPRWF